MSIFEEVKAQLNIRQVIESFGVKVNRRGQFVCPFHNDHRPSASIKDDYYHCFVCNSGGDLITFTAKYLGLSNLDAAKELIRIFNLNIDISTPEERKAQYMAEKKRREEVKKQVSLRGKFAKDKEIRAERRAFTDYKMRADRTQAAKKKEQEQEEIRQLTEIFTKMDSYTATLFRKYINSLNSEGKQKLLDYAKDLSQLEKYTAPDPDSENEE